jgi:hypothetical protein
LPRTKKKLYEISGEETALDRWNAVAASTYVRPKSESILSTLAGMWEATARCAAAACARPVMRR